MSGEAFADSDRLFGILDEPVPSNEGAHRTHDAIADLFTVYDDFHVAREEPLEFVEQAARPLIDVVCVVGTVLVGDSQLVVVVQIMGCRNDADQTSEVVFPDPDDLFLSSDASMIVPVSTRPFTYRQPILENPCEVPGSDSQSPFSSQLRWHG